MKALIDLRERNALWHIHSEFMYLYFFFGGARGDGDGGGLLAAYQRCGGSN